MLNPIIRPLGRNAVLPLLWRSPECPSPACSTPRVASAWSALSDKSAGGDQYLLCVFTIACALLLMFVHGYAYIVIVVITAFAFGGPSAINPATTTDFFGAKYTGTNYGVAMLSLGFSSIIFNAISNALVKSTGRYYMTFVMGAITAAITIALQIIMKKYKKKTDA
jgi:MFS family permease